MRVLVRATVGVEAHTHEFIATAHEDQKFGFSLADGDVHEAVRRVLAAPSLELVGVHSHIGSQIFDTSGFEVAAHRVVGLLGALRDEHGIELPELNLGGGMGIVYTSTDDPVDVAETARSLRDIVTRECASRGLAVPTLAIEPGRGIAGPGTITVYEVGTVKPVKGLRTFVSVDGGMSDNIRTALYGADYTVTLASRDSTAAPMLSRVVGKHCESGDVVVTDTWLPSDLVPGDLLAVAATGAYCRAMASSYNHVPRPPVVAVREDGTRLLLRRETVADLLSLEVTVGRESAVIGSGWLRSSRGAHHAHRSPGHGHGGAGAGFAAGRDRSRRRDGVARRHQREGSRLGGRAAGAGSGRHVRRRSGARRGGAQRDRRRRLARRAAPGRSGEPRRQGADRRRPTR